MKTISKKYLFPALMALIGLTLVSCEKENQNEEGTNENTEEVAIAVAASTTTGISGTAEDSVYILHECSKEENREVATEAGLASTIRTYLSENYAGYKFHKAFVVKKRSEVKGYIVVIYYNDKPVALKFDATGKFVKVLEQREKKDIRGKGWHLGGRFQNRGGLMKDTIAISTLPLELVTYFKATYATDTIVKAFRTHDNGYLLISKSNGVYATTFNASAAFVSRIKLNRLEGKISEIETAALLPAITAYLQATYPGYVVNKAFNITANGVVRGYVVLIDANNTRYSVMFNAAGNFEAAKAIR